MEWREFYPNMIFIFFNVVEFIKEVQYNPSILNNKSFQFLKLEVDGIHVTPDVPFKAVIERV